MHREAGECMFKKTTTKNFLLCIFITMLGSLLFIHLADVRYSVELVVFILFFSALSTFFTVYIFKNQFIAENEERENKLKQQIEYNACHFSTIINNLPLIAYIINKDYKFITGNSEALKFFGDIENCHFRKLTGDIFDGDTMELIKEENEFIMRNKKPFVTDKLIKLKNGKQNWFKIRKVPTFDKKNNVNGFVIFGRDIEAEKAAQKQRETYISTLSHDLKIPTLAQIRALELLESGNMGPVNPQQREIIHATLDSCRFMYEMLSTILATYKYENKDISLSYEKIQVLKLIDECFNKSYKSMRNKNIHVRVKAKEKFFTLYADKTELKKAFENLISHCVSSAYENTEIILEIKKTNNFKNIFLSLAFESPYLSSDILNNMFKMYTTPAEKLDKVGSSLGLYLAKQIIDAHHGNINVKSKESDYNIYNIELPCINECKLSATKL